MVDVRTVSEAAEAAERDRLRGALLWLLWHHQGASSVVGLACRHALRKGQHEHLYPGEVAQAEQWHKRYAKETP
jgi:hypothetical protein